MLLIFYKAYLIFIQKTAFFFSFFGQVESIFDSFQRQKGASAMSGL